jgi:hypothetical protein
MSSEHEPPPASGDIEPGEAPGALDEASEAALIQHVVHMQGRHREGGIDAEPGERDQEAEPGQSP